MLSLLHVISINSNFLSVTVIGCAELSPPPHAWYKREGNKAIIGCEDNDKEWTVSCTGNRWVGEIGNCTKLGIIFIIKDTIHFMSTLELIIIVRVKMGVKWISTDYFTWKS